MPVDILESVLARFKGKVQHGITLTKWMIAKGYQDARTLKRRINAMEDRIANGVLLDLSPKFRLPGDGV